MPKQLVLLVDPATIGDHPELSHLLSFNQVEGIEVEHQISLVEEPDRNSFAVIGAEGSRRVGLPAFHQLKSFAAEITSDPASTFNTDTITRVLNLLFLAGRLEADAVVSPIRNAFDTRHRALLSGVPLWTVEEALAVIGANVRQRNDVPLGGAPLLTQRRTEVYHLIALSIVPNGQDWWSACVHGPGAAQDGWLGYAEAALSRIGQALRGRDGVHESLRAGSGRPAILDALYHFDVVLMSSVGALDALARVAHEAFAVPMRQRDAAWQFQGWVARLRELAPSVADVTSAESVLGAAVRVLTRTRNSIHGIPLNEFLHVEAGASRSLAEHRVMIDRDLALALGEVSGPLGSLEQYGVHTDVIGTPYVRVGEFCEQILSWTVDIASALMQAMLGHGAFTRGPTLELDPLARLERQYFVALARIGEYPCRTGLSGLPASPDLHRRIMGTISRTRLHS
jgi:hypothetical protein